MFTKRCTSILFAGLIICFSSKSFSNQEINLDQSSPENTYKTCLITNDFGEEILSTRCYSDQAIGALMWSIGAGIYKEIRELKKSEIESERAKAKSLEKKMESHEAKYKRIFGRKSITEMINSPEIHDYFFELENIMPGRVGGNRGEILISEVSKGTASATETRYHNEDVHSKRTIEFIKESDKWLINEIE